MFKVLLFSLFCILAASSLSQAQSCSITVSTQVVKSQPGKRTGQIKLTIEGDKQDGRFKLFLLNQGAEQAKKEIENRQVQSLKSGLYEFIVIDTKREKCFKEISVQVTEAN